ncbi:MAG: MCE family protein [Alphaproteobacteria bacterium]|nr:MCE family protein [Alphaproteobacteria bacterium]
MEPNKNYFLVGIFVLATVAASVLFALWLTGANRTEYYLYRIRFAESVSGLNVGSPVKFRGVDVGKVTQISIDPDNSNLVRVDVRIAEGTPIKTDTQASLKLQGITGAYYVELTGGSQDMPNLKPPRIGGIPEIPAKASDIAAIVNRMPELIDKATVVADQLSKLVNNENVAAFSDMMGHWKSIAAALDQQTQQFSQLIDQATAVANDVHQITHDSKDDIRATADALKESSRQLNALIARTNRAAGGSYEEFYQLLVEIKRTTRDLSGLAKELEENPSRIISPQQQKGIPAP